MNNLSVGFWGYVFQALSLLGSFFTHDNLQTMTLLCGIVSAVFTIGYFRSAKKKADAEYLLLKNKIKKQRLKME